MCGIWGIIPGQYTPATSVKKFVANCLIAGTVRGDHGSGIMMLGAKGVSEIVKGAEDGSALLSYKGAYKALDDNIKDCWAIVGHNRAATRGDIDDHSAHPFRHGRITLVHNGYISNADWLPGVEDSPKKNRVDSDLLCEAMNAAGHDKILQRVHGAYALCWHDQLENSLRMVRNSQRPLSFMRLGCGGIAFASEGDMLWWLAGRASLARGDVRELATDTLLRIGSDMECTAEKVVRPVPSYYNDYYERMEGTKSTSTSTTGAASTVTVVGDAGGKRKGVLKSLGLSGNTPLEFEIYAIEPHHGEQKKYKGICMALGPQSSDEIFNAVLYAHDNPLLDIGNSIFVRAVGVMKSTGKRDQPVLIVRPRSAPTEEEVGKEEEFIGPHGTKMNEESWLASVAVGCTECRSSITLEDAPEVRWIFNESSPLCPKCSSGYLEHNAPQRQLLQ